MLYGPGGSIPRRHTPLRTQREGTPSFGSRATTLFSTHILYARSTPTDKVYAHMAQASNRINMRLTDLEKSDWSEAAGGTRLLSQWIRQVCNDACEKARGGGLAVAESTPPNTKSGIERLIDEQRTPPNTKPALIEAAIADQLHRESRSLAAAQAPGADSSPRKRAASGGGPATCPRWFHHKPGVYCGACKQVIGK